MNRSLYMAEPPVGQVRNEVDSPNLHRELIISGLSFTGVAAFAVVLRFFTRISVTKNGIQYDDYMILSALAFSIVSVGVSFGHMEAGMGYHYWDVKTKNFVHDFQVYTLINTICFAMSLALTKISILLFYLRLSPQRWFRFVVCLLIGVIITYAFTYDLLSIFSCRLIAASWNLRLAPATCVNTWTKYMALSILNIAIDIITLILPIPVIVVLQMPTRQKIGVIIIFLAGGLVCIIAIRRTILLTPLMYSNGYTWDAIEQYHWCFAEINMSIICASIPALKPFTSKYIPSCLTSGCGNSGRRDNGYVVDSAESNNHPLHTISQMRTRKLASKDAYELHSTDNLSLERVKPGNEDDEARLWGDHKGKGHNTSRNTLPIQAPE